MTRDRESLAHQEWLGYVQPVGLVVSIPALLAAQAHVNRNIAPDHQRFLACLPRDNDDEPIPEIRDFAEFARSVLGWRKQDLEPLQPGDTRYAALEVTLPEYHETLRPTHVVREFTPKDPSHPWMMLVRVLPVGTEMDKVAATDDRHWQATTHAKFERLLRETRVPIGLLASNSQIRLVYAPRGETSGFATFSVAEMVQVAGRPIFAALHMLLGEERLFSLGEKQRLPAILADSRKYQNVVSTKLAEQVLAALFELVRGFQAANDQAKGDILRDVLGSDPNHVYHGLLTVLMRLVFILYAEDRGLLSNDRVYVNYYAVTGLFDRLRADAGRFPDTMDLRYGAWAQLLTLFRLVYEGGRHGGLHIPARQGYLFDPNRYPFLEGRGVGRLDLGGGESSMNPDNPSPRSQLPRVSDGVVFRVLNNLLILDGERLSYRTLDVEQIGSVYEAIMGFNLEVARGPSIAVKPKKAHGAPASINLEDLLAAKPADRPKWLKEQTDQALTGLALDSLKKSETIEDLLAALEKRIAREVTPNVVSKGAMVLQPSDERRRSGSHYTPRSLTEPIVRTTFRPILERLGPTRTPDQILDLKVCDPAMGSGAFLVEACRQLAEELVKAWHTHDCVPSIPPDEDEILHARRIVAQRCLYGVDKNPMAVDLAKLSLWLATLAKDHPFTFLDHALRDGDSLVGLTKAQILGFHWRPDKQRDFARSAIEGQLNRALDQRRQIREAPEGTADTLLRERLMAADGFINPGRRYGDLVVSAYFAADNDRERKERIDILAAELAAQRSQFEVERHNRLDAALCELRDGAHPIHPFHWEIEFPEVFDRENSGFDALVGNPPFLGGTLIGGRLGLAYHDYLVDLYPPATGLADVIAFFLRKCFSLLRHEGTFGLIATNTVAQGDTRNTGLQPILNQGGAIYQAQRRYKWPGVAAVVVSVVHIIRTERPLEPILDGVPVERISAYLLKGNADTTPVALLENKGISYRGTKIWGAGFVFEDNPSDGSSSLSEMQHLISNDARNREVIFKYIGGEEFNTSPTQMPRRYVIDFGDMSESDARRWPALFAIVEERVRPIRLGNKQRNYRENWWLHANRVDETGPYLRQHGRFLALTCVSKHACMAFVYAGTIVADSMIILLLNEYHDFALIKSRVHEIWTRFVGSSLEDRLRYTTPCFDTFPRPFPNDLSITGEIGEEYYRFRSRLMVNNSEGFTDTYNRFHDPYETSPDIAKLRELHDAMDRAVLDAYGWTDLKPTCEFLLDYEDEDDEDEGESGSTGRTRKKPWRYRWPDEFRDEVLARLLDLNQKRAELERLSGIAAAESGGGKTKKKSTGARKAPQKSADQPDLFGGVS